MEWCPAYEMSARVNEIKMCWLWLRLVLILILMFNHRLKLYNCNAICFALIVEHEIVSFGPFGQKLSCGFVRTKVFHATIDGTIVMFMLTEMSRWNLFLFTMTWFRASVSLVIKFRFFFGIDLYKTYFILSWNKMCLYSKYKFVAVRWIATNSKKLLTSWSEFILQILKFYYPIDFMLKTKSMFEHNILRLLFFFRI